MKADSYPHDQMLIKDTEDRVKAECATGLKELIKDMPLNIYYLDALNRLSDKWCNNKNRRGK